MDHLINQTDPPSFDPIQQTCQQCGDPIVYLFMPEFEMIPDHAKKPMRWTIRWPERLRCLACWRAEAPTPTHLQILDREERSLARAFRTIFPGLAAGVDDGAPTLFGSTSVYRDIPGAQRYSTFTVREFSLFVPSLPKDLDSLPFRSAQTRLPGGLGTRCWISPLVEVSSERTKARLQKIWDLDTGEVRENLLDTADVPDADIHALQKALELFDERLETRGGPKNPLTEEEILAAIRATREAGLEPTAVNVAENIPGRSLGDTRLRQLRRRDKLFPGLRWREIVRLAGD